jgi:FAD/FMN-containing dehydrogenase
MTDTQTISRTGAFYEDLAANLHGRLITPGSDDYDAARQLFIGGTDPKPAAIARVADTEDVSRVILFAHDRDVPLTVRSGGHTDFGSRNADDGLVLDIRDLRSLDIDVDGRTAWAGAGWTADGLTRALQEHGLLVGFGDTGSVGISGITLGGGIGYVARKFGMTIDALLAAEIVTADGQLLLVDPDHEPDLFWAIRGGGGNFGVVTRFKYRLEPVGQVYGGMLVLPATVETVDGFIRAASAASNNLSTIANVMPAPPMPFLPLDLHGKPIVLAFMIALGDVAEGELQMAPFRALATPVADMLRPMAYSEIYMPEDPNYRPNPVQRTFFLDSIDAAKAQAILEALAASDAPLRAVQIRVLGGAMSRVPNDATAFAHRDAPLMAVVVNFTSGEAEDKQKRAAWADALAAELRDRDRRGAYVNFMTLDSEQVDVAYPPATLARLRQIKRRYDPNNMFRGNVNIRPA